MLQVKVSQRHQTTLLLAILVSLLLASMPALGVNPNRRLRAGEKIAREAAKQVIMSQQRLGGLGSTPPTCRSKCGSCAPCKPVHISIKPGLCTPLEYYPEAWRCKCADKLFMP